MLVTRQQKSSGGSSIHYNKTHSTNLFVDNSPIELNSNGESVASNESTPKLKTIHRFFPLQQSRMDRSNISGMPPHTLLRNSSHRCTDSSLVYITLPEPLK